MSTVCTVSNSDKFEFLYEYYDYELKAMNQQVKRNLERFPEDFMFQLTRDEVELVKSQIVTSRDNTFFRTRMWS